MEETPQYQMPPTDTSPFSLVMWAQFGFFALILYEFNQNTDAMGSSEYVFLGAVLVTALLQLLRVNNRRMIGMLLMMAAAIVSWGIFEGEMGGAIAGLIFFIIPFFGMVIYIPALGFDEHGMELPRERRKLILVIVMSLCIVFFTAMENIDLATAEDGTYVTEDMDGDTIYEIDDMNVNLAKASIGLAVTGVLIFLAITLGGMTLGGLRPWHGIAIGASAAWVDGYNWSDFGQDPLWLSCLWALMITVMFVVTAREFFENGEETTG